MIGFFWNLYCIQYFFGVVLGRKIAPGREPPPTNSPWVRVRVMVRVRVGGNLPGRNNFPGGNFTFTDVERDKLQAINIY